MTNKLVWRLSKLPSVDELQSLVKDKIITQDEAREILFKSETEEDRDKESLKSEIKFLRDLVEQLSKNNSTKIIESIRYIDRSYQIYPWYNHYQVWCGTTQATAGSLNVATAGSLNVATAGSLNVATAQNAIGGLGGNGTVAASSFNTINTF